MITADRFINITLVIPCTVPAYTDLHARKRTGLYQGPVYSTILEGAYTVFRQNRNSKINDILRMIDDNPSNWKKAAFYSDEEIMPLLEDLQRRWEESNNEGIPIEYASDEELDLLLAKARKYYYMSEAEAVSIVMARQRGLQDNPGSVRRSGIRGILDKIRGKKA